MRARISICLVLGPLFVATIAHAQAMKPGAQANPAPAKPAPPAAKPAAKKPRPTVAPRGYISVNGGYQATTNTFSSTWTFDYYADIGSATAQYPVKGSFIFDGGGGVRAWRDLMVGAAFSRYNRSDEASMTASVPHPFNFTFRDAQGIQAGLSHAETAIHLHVMWMLRPRGRLQVGLFGGPTVFSVRQALVTTPTFNEVYPYDTVTISGAATKEQSATTVGLNAGADIGYGLSKTVAIGVLLRFARGTASFETPSKSVIDVHAGGMQVAAGVRVRFWESRKPATTPGTKGKK